MMKRLGFLAVACFAAVLLAGCGGGEETAADAPPPILDRDLFFGDPQYTNASISPDGAFIAFVKPYRDVRNVWVKGIDEPFDAARPVTADQRPVTGYFWSRDGKYVLYVQDKGGNENFHVYAVDPAAEPEADSGVPPARNLTPVEGARAFIQSVPRDKPGEIIVGLNDRDPSLFDIYRVDIASGERELILENNMNLGGMLFDDQGKARLAVQQVPGGGTRVLRVDGDDMTAVYDVAANETAAPVQVHPDGKRIWMITNKGADVDLAQLVLFDPETGEVEPFESDPDGRVDFGGAMFHPATDELMATFYIGDRLRIYPKNDETKKDLEILREKLPDGELGLSGMTADASIWLVSVSRDVDPGSVYVYRRETGDVDLLYRSRPELPSEHLAEMKPVRYTARDGMEIPAYLTLPKGVEPTNLPVVLHPHGGPWARDNWGYNPYVQFLANRGYAVLQPNFRSSTGYGKAFVDAGDHEWGTGAMQHDLTDGVQWLIDQGIADPERVCIFGGSYGGYATLAGVTFTPDLYACAVPYVAPSSLITLIESFPAYWRPFLENSWFLRVGDPEEAAERGDLDARSPINHIDAIRVPLLVVHGANDPRVTQPESDRLVAAMRDKGLPVEYIVAPDEGHGFRAPANRKALAVAVEQFFAKHLGGRVQEDVPADVAAHLETLRVDPATVSAPSGVH
jgi:dipeptidyl aminopeptidase/acylaminoacyl peptidase